MQIIRYILLGVALLVSSTAASYADEHEELLRAAYIVRDIETIDLEKVTLSPSDLELIQASEKLLAENQTTLIQIVKGKGQGWTTAVDALTRLKHPDIVPLLIQLFRQNFYLKEADGSQMKFGYGSKNGCELRTNRYGAELATCLGQIGDARAVPALEEAVALGDPYVKAEAYGSLYRLGKISFDELLEIANQPGGVSFHLPTTIGYIILELGSKNPKEAIELFDRVILEFPTRPHTVAFAQYHKISYYRALKEYERALEQCDIALQYTDSADYYIDSISTKRKLIKEQMKQ